MVSAIVARIQENQGFSRRRSMLHYDQRMRFKILSHMRGTYLNMRAQLSSGFRGLGFINILYFLSQIRVRATSAQVRLRICACSAEPSLLNYAIITLKSRELLPISSYTVKSV